MKTKNYLTALFIMLLATTGLFAQFTGAGAGTKADPYQITTSGQLHEVRSYLLYHFKLMNDLDLTSYANWEPIGTSASPFKGSFNGNGKIISNLTINRTTTDNVGLFGYFYPTTYVDSIAFVGLKNVNVKGQDNVGGLVGRTYMATLEQCFTTGVVQGRRYVGGIAGVSSQFTRNCYSACKVISTWEYSANSGGIAGDLNNGYILNCYATGSVVSNGNNNGGIVGSTTIYHTKNNVSINLNIKGTNTLGRIISSSSTATSNNYAYENTRINGEIVTGTHTSQHGQSTSIGTLKDSLFYKTAGNWENPWNFTTVWTMDTVNVSPFPILRKFSTASQTIEHPQTMYWEQLIAGGIGSFIKLQASGTMAKIEYTSSNPTVATISNDTLFVHNYGTVEIKAKTVAMPFYAADSLTRTFRIGFYGEGTKANPFLIERATQLDSIRYYLSSHFTLANDIDLSSYSNWLPIGNITNRFTGSFDGNGKIISNLKINRSTTDNVGLFGYFLPATLNDSIKNVGLVNVDIYGRSATGAIAGYVQNGYIVNCFSSGLVLGSFNNTGGIAGQLRTAHISNCYSVCTVSGRVSGGIVGLAETNSSVKYCYSTGRIYYSGSVYIGGTVGASTSTTIENIVALNSEIVADGSATKRISGYNGMGTTMSNNYAWEYLPINTNYVTDGIHNDVNGQSKPLDTFQGFGFFTEPTNWNSQAWDFADVWGVDNINISPYPYLKIFATTDQKLVHNQKVNWPQVLTGGIGSTIELTARAQTAITYTSSNPTIASIDGSSLMVHQGGTVQIKARTTDSPFYVADSVTKTYSVTFVGDGTKESPYLIEREAQFDSVRYHLHAHFKLVADLDLSGYPNWVPLSSSATRFTGSFNGNNHIISNVALNTPGSYKSVFGYYAPAISGDSIKNVNLENVNISGSDYTGGLLGCISNGTLFQCSVSGSVSGTSMRTGGLVGWAVSNSLIDQCRSTVEVTSISNYTGGLVGYLDVSTITASFYQGNVTGVSYVGGIVGQIWGSGVSYVNNCYSTGNIIGQMGGYVGGIVGYSNDSYISYCYSTATITANDYAGGIAGNHRTYPIKNNVAANAAILKTGDWGGIMGRVYGEAFEGANNYGWSGLYVNNQAIENGELTNPNGQDVSTLQMSDPDFYTNSANWDTQAWDFDAVWHFDTENTSPFPILQCFANDIQKTVHTQVISWTQPATGSVNDTLILTAGGGVNPITYVSANPAIASVVADTLFIHATGNVDVTAHLAGSEFFSADSLTRNFFFFGGGEGTKENPYLVSNATELNNVRNNMAAHYRQIANIDLSSIEQWEPIGKDNNGWEPFKGSFDGNHFTISNLKINDPNLSNAGLFGVYEPNVLNDSIKNITLTDVKITASDLVGGVVGYLYRGTVYNCTVSGNIQSNGYAGAIAGQSQQSDIINCTGECTVKVSDSNYAGGIVGYFEHGNISGCTASGNISAYYEAGGIIGYAYFASINNSSFTGTVSGTEYYKGGIAGYIDNSIMENCYSKGNISGSSYIGGIVGEIYQSTINQCFSYGTVEANNTVGGIAGYVKESSVIENSYSAARVTSTGESSTGGIAGVLEDSEVKTTYSTGVITIENEIGGIAGYAVNSTIKNSVGANAKIGHSGSLNRVLGHITSSTLINNYGWIDMYVGSDLAVGGALDNQNGSNVSFQSLIDSAFYKNAMNWETAWDFETVWTMDTTTASAYPILKSISYDAQMTNHPQAITWEQDFSGLSVGDTVILEAKGGASGSEIYYASSNPEVAYINADSLFIVGLGGTMITAYIDASKYFLSTNMSKPVVIRTTAGTPEDPHLISTLAELDAVRLDLTASYSVVADIDMSSVENWEPIGNSSDYFTGSFNGNNHTISNLTINRPAGLYLGLFGWTETDTIQNVILENVQIIGNEYVGAIAGYVGEDGVIAGCNVSGSIQGDYEYAGGISGYSYYATIENCGSEVQLSNFYDYIGGIVGYADNSRVENSYFTGTMENIYTEAGGIVGYSYESDILGCFNAGTISGRGYVGGIVGNGYYSSILNNYNVADMTANENYLGGIMGESYICDVKYNYNTGIINGSGADYVGGIIGHGYIGNIKNNVSISAKITITEPASDYNAGRISGSGGTFAKNIAWNNMYVNDAKVTTGTVSNKNGVSYGVWWYKSADFFTTIGFWDVAPWDLTNVWEMNSEVSPYPVLKNIPLEVQTVQHSQVITDAWEQELPTEGTAGETIALTCPLESPSEQLTYVSDNPEVASISGTTLTLNKLGSAVISAFYPEGTFYKESGTISRTVTVTNKGSQEIYWDQDLSSTYGDEPFELTATTSSGLEITYVSGDETVAQINGNQLIVMGAGETNITATQEGNEGFEAAEPVSLILTVSKRNLNFSNFVVAEKVYDGTAIGTLESFDDDRIEGDSLAILFDVGFTEYTVGENITVQITNPRFTECPDSGNYNLPIETLFSTGTIVPRQLNLTNFTAEDKIYDGDTLAIASFDDDRVDNDNLEFSVEATFDNKNVGENKTVHITNVEITGGGLKDNYFLGNTTGQATASITPRGLSVSDFTATDKTYDGTVEAGIYNFQDTRIAGDALEFSYLAQFENKNVGNNKQVIISNISISGGADVNNYTLYNTTSATTASITEKEVWVVNAVAQDKTYDGTNVATITGAEVPDLIEGDYVTLANHTTGTFAQIGVGENIEVTHAMSLSGTDANNYILHPQGVLHADITAKTLSFAGMFQAADKTYDGNTTATLSYNGLSIEGTVEPDVVSISSVTLVFDSKNVGEEKNVSIIEIEISGDVDNYVTTLVNSPMSTASINPATLTVINAVAQNKEYNGNSNASISGAELQGVIAPDMVNLGSANTGTFAQVTVGENIAVSTNMTLSGAGKDNYTLEQPELFADITPKPLTITANDALKTVGTELVLVGTEFTNSDMIGNDVVTSVTLTSEGAGTEAIAGDYDIVASNALGTGLENYAIDYVAGTLTVLNQVQLTLNGLTITDKVYDGTNMATVSNWGTLVPVAEGHEVTLDISNATVTFANKNVGNNKTVTITGLALSGANAGDYFINNHTRTANITARPLTLSNFVADDKTYDATTAATGTTFADNRIEGDIVYFGFDFAFADKNVGTNKEVLFTNITLNGGADKNNYVLESTTGTAYADITTATLTVINAVAQNKIYDGNTQAEIVGAELSGVLAEDVVNLNNSTVGTFAQNSYGLNIPVTTAMTISGTDGQNYLLQQPTYLTANINPRPLTITANNLVKTVGQVYTFTGTEFTTSEMVSGDMVTSVTLTSNGAAADALVGEYDIIPSLATGIGVGNYNKTYVNGTMGVVSQVQLTLNGLTISDKVYDGTNMATVTNWGTLEPVTEGHDVTLDISNATVTFANKNAGNNKTVTISGLALSGVNAGDYFINNHTRTADITARPLTVSNFVADSKTYDGTTAVTGDNFDDNRLEGDVLSITYNVAFDNKNVGVDKVVNFTNITVVAGADMNNYTLESTTGTATASIFAKELTITGSFTVLDKEYDATTVASLDQNNLLLVGVVGSEDVVLNPVAAFASANVGSNILVSLTAATSITGTDINNYSLSLVGAPTTTATITEPSTPYYTLTVSSIGQGTVTINGNVYSQPITVMENTVLNVVASPSAGWQFANWTGPVAEALEATTTVTMTGNTTITATFVELFALTLTANPTEGGTVSGTGNYAAGAVVEITATANTDFVFVNWTLGETIISTQAVYTYTMPAEAVTLAANFRAKVSASINPTSGTFDESNPENLSTIITWNDATTVTSVVAMVEGEEYELTEGEEYTITDIDGETALLTFILADEKLKRFRSKEEMDIPVTINFDYGTPAVYTITFIWVDTYLVSFNVTDDNGQPIVGATITFEGIFLGLKTDGNGYAWVELENGDYTFTVSKEGYISETESVTVSDNDVEINIQLSLVGISDVTLTTVKLYPNPVVDVVNLERNTTERVTIEVYSNNGALLHTAIWETATLQLNVADYKNGMFYIRVVGQHVENLRFIKQ